MIKRKEFNRTVYLSTTTVPEELNDDFSDATLYFNFSNKDIRVRDYEEVVVDTSSHNTDVFVDSSDNRVYLTNFVHDQNVLDLPVEAIVVSDMEIQIFIGEKCLNFLPRQLSDKFKSENFIYELFGIARESLARKKSSFFVESQDPFDNWSAELGVYSTSTNDFTDILNKSSDSDDTLGSVSEPVEAPSQSMEQSESSVSVRKIRKTKLDGKLEKNTAVERMREKVAHFFNGEKVTQKEIAIGVNSPLVYREHDASDPVLMRLKEEIAREKNLQDFDPIVVVKREESLHVISGSKRVEALKMANKKIYGYIIDSKDEPRFMVHNFFLKSDQKVHSTAFLINILVILCELLDLPIRTVAELTSKEKTYVFGQMFGPTTSLALLLDLIAFEEVKNSIIQLSNNGIDLSNYVLREISKKNRKNPKRLLAILNGQWKSLSDLKTAVEAIQPDINHNLIDKGIEKDTANYFDTLYSGNKDFASFLSGADLRHVKKNDQRESIACKYNTFLALRRKRKLQETSVRVGSFSETFDILVTNSMTSANHVLSEKSSVTVLVFGSEANSSYECILALPDEMGIEDELGRLELQVSMSIMIKYEGKELSGKDITEYLAQYDFQNLISAIVSKGTSIIVKTQKDKKRLEKSLTNQH